jgi:prolyl-tRNA synthetase
MRHTNIFTKTRKESPKDELVKNAQVLIKAGYVHKEMAGVYAYMPFGLKVLENIKKIARDEMSKVSGQEMIMASLQKKEIWESTDRWDDQNVDIWFKSQLKNGTDVGFAWSHEEPITEMMKNFIVSYKDLPIYAYQFQTKMRNELRAKSGIMRGREFLMKDLYSYSSSIEEHEAFYHNMITAYISFYKRCCLGDDTYVTVAAGGVFTKNISHEFQTICDAGEDTIYIDRENNIVYNEEAIDDSIVDKNKLEKHKTAEVGNIFSFGGEKCEQMGLLFMDKDGEKKPVILGSYGIGITRVMGVIVEKYADEKGLVWPKNISPFDIEIVSLFKEEGDEVHEESEKIYKALKDKYEVLYDDRLMPIVSKMQDADLYGVPLQIIIGEKTLDKDMVQIKNRQSGEVVEVGLEDIERGLEEMGRGLF